jgi:WD40 repeat protein
MENSFLNTHAAPGEFAVAVKNKTRRLLSEELTKSFPFEIDNISLHGLSVFMSSGKTIYRYDLIDDILKELFVSDFKIVLIAVHPHNGSLLASFSNRYNRILSVDTAELIFEFTTESEVRSACFSDYINDIIFNVDDSLHALEWNEKISKKFLKKIGEPMLYFDIVDSLKSVFILTEQLKILVYNFNENSLSNFAESMPPVNAFQILETSKSVVLHFSHESIEVWSTYSPHFLFKVSQETIVCRFWIAYERADLLMYVDSEQNSLNYKSLQENEILKKFKQVEPITGCVSSKHSDYILLKLGGDSIKAFKIGNKDFIDLYKSNYRLIQIIFNKEQSVAFMASHSFVKAWDLANKRFIADIHNDPEKNIRNIAIHHKRNLLYVTCKRGNIKVFDSVSYEFIQDIQTETFEIVTISIHNNKDILLFSSNSKYVEAWSIPEYKHSSRVLRGKAIVKTIGCSEKYGSVIYQSGNSEILLSQAENLEKSVLLSKTDDLVCFIDIVDESGYAFIGTNFSILVSNFLEIILIKTVNIIDCVSSFCRIDNDIILITNLKGEISLWNYRYEKIMEEIHHTNNIEILSMAYSDKLGTLLLMAVSGEVSTLDTKRTLFAKKIANQDDEPFGLRISDKRQAIYSFGSMGTIQSFDFFECKKSDFASFSTYYIYSFELSESLNLIFRAGDSPNIQAFDISQQKHVRDFGDHSKQINCLQLIDNLRLLVSTSIDGMIKVWKIDTFQLDQELKNEECDAISAMSIDKRNNNLYFGDKKGKISYWDPNFQISLKTFGGHYGVVVSLAVSENLDYLCSCSKDNALKFWSLKDYCLLKINCYDASLNSLAIKEDKNLLFGIKNSSVLCVWDLMTFNIITEMSHPSKETMSTIAVSNKVNKIYTSSSSTTKIFEWDISNLLKLSHFDRLFIEKCLLNELNAYDFLNKYRILRFIYQESYMLRTYFNVCLCMVIQKNEQIIKELYKSETDLFDTIGVQISPLVYCIRSMHIDTIKLILQFLIKNKIRITINPELANFLLHPDNNFGHEFLEKNIANISKYKLTKTNIERTKKFAMHTNLFYSIWPFFDDKTFEQIPVKSNLEKRTMEIFDFGICWDFDRSCKSSIDFLSCYHKSETDEFILSPYRYFIFLKWNRYFVYYFPQTLLYWTHVALYSIILINNASFELFLTDLLVLSLFCLYEILSFVSSPSTYIENYWNFVDIFNLITCFVFISLEYSEYENNQTDVYKIFQIISIFFVCLRGFTFFNAFPQFSYITKMTISMITNSVSIGLMIIYFSLGFSVMLVKSNSQYSFLDSLVINYNLVFGNVPELGDKNYLQIILIILGSILLPIFLINFLIAKLSGTYSTLEDRQKALIYKELAGNILELEKIGQFIRRIFSRPNASKLRYTFLAVDQKTENEEESGMAIENRIMKLGRKVDKTSDNNLKSFKKKMELQKQQISVSFRELKGFIRNKDSSVDEDISSLERKLEDYKSSADKQFAKFDLFFEKINTKLEILTKRS